ncbi:MAG: hypothetical protein HY812_07515 [Planctomycetes bacterium]|nr:hypothetical protein [Planctomycetota bacterium]
MKTSRVILATGILCALATAARADIVVPGPDGIIYVANGTALTSSGSSGTALGTCGPTDVVHFQPVFTFSAEKILTNATINVLLGDHDGDGDHFENILGGIDAIDLLRVPVQPSVTRTVYEYVYSASDPFAGVANGSIFRFVPGFAAGDFIEVVLSEAQILAAIGQGLGDAANTDAFTQDDNGNVYLSFADDELVNTVLVGDGGVVMIPGSALTYSPAGVVTAVVSGSAVLLLNEADVDAMIVTAGLLTASAVGDLSCLAIDTVGKTFIGLDGQAHPNLFFSGESLGPVVFTTDAGGAFGVTSFGAPLGAPTPDLFQYGLASMSGGIGALTVLGDTGRPLAMDVPDGEIAYPGETLVEWDVGNCVPNSVVLFLVKVFPGTPGNQPTALQVWGKIYPEIFTYPVGWNLVFFLPTDFNGVAVLQGTLTHSISPYVLVGQAYDPGNALFPIPEQLGAPGAIWFP